MDKRNVRGDHFELQYLSAMSRLNKNIESNYMGSL